jgi:spiro-SPASM protein
MKNIAVINGTGLQDPAFRPLIDGVSASARALAFARSLPDVDSVILLLSRPQPALAAEGVRHVVRDAWTVASPLGEMAAAAETFQDVFYFFADCPYLDRDLSLRMHASHRRYWADYTFADGYPYGLTPEIFTRETVERMRGMAPAGEAPGTSAPDRESLFTVIKKDINSFDIETEISPVDMRMMRVSLSADTERNFLLLGRIAARGGRDATGVCDILSRNQDLLRTLPAFFPVQIVERCPQACTYCPYPLFGGKILEKSGWMPVDAFTGLVRKISSFAGDAVIDISLWGEPALHPAILDIARAALSEPGVELVIETSGVGWQPGLLRRFHESLERAPTWIVSLDAATEEMYRKLRGDGFAEATRTAEELLALFPGRAWVQAVRMKENEDDLDSFYRAWKARTENVIVQKYDSFAGFLPDRTVADLSPLKRFPCWHLKRDMAILLDGTVPLCREDIKVETPLGNAFTEDLATVWSRAHDIYRGHVDGRYPAICARCDEYYTYNY